MNLIVDIGNTRLKCALFDAGRVVAEMISEHFDRDEIARWMAPYSVRHAILCSTRRNEVEVAESLRTLGVEVLLFDAHTAVPLRSDYLTPESLGRDRLAAAVGADVRYPGRSVLVVDFGTAITCDLISDHTYRGGSIAPGMRMRFRALHEMTARLPLVEPSDEPVGCGRTTEECIRGGVMNGIRYEIEGYIARFGAENRDLLVIFTGGDAKHFEKQIKNTIFADCDLVLLGLNRILEYHISCR